MTDNCTTCPLRDIAEAISIAGNEAPEPVEINRDEKLAFSSVKNSNLFGVCSGILGRQHLLSDGRRSIVELFMKGDIIRGDSVPRNTEVIALTPCKLVSLDTKELDRLRRSSHKVDAAYQRCIENQNCILAEHCADISKKTPPERVASFLIEYAKRKMDDDGDMNKVAMKLLGKDIGEYLALETETVSRSYAKLKESGVLSLLKPGMITVTDQKKLREIADGGMPRKRKASTR